MEDSDNSPKEPDTQELAREIALKAAAEIAAQTEFAVIDASHRESVHEVSKRFDAIRHYAERALQALSRVDSHRRDSVQ